MSDLEFSQDEQEQKVKEWWSNNRNSILGGIAIGLVGVWGWNYYKGYQHTQAKEAAGEYSAFLGAADDAVSADAAVSRIKEVYPNTAYATIAGMARAAQVINEDVDKAIANLKLAAENAPDKGMREIANIRLARVLIDANRADEAQAVVDGLDFEGAFAAYAFELKGDLLHEKNEDAAKDAYASALELLDPMGLDREVAQLLERKISNL